MSGARSERTMLVVDWMTRSPVTVPPEAPLRMAVSLFRQHRFRHLPVVSGGKLCGVLSDRDVKSVTPVPATGSPFTELAQAYDRPVFEVMNTEVITVGPGDSIEEAARMMRRHKIGCLLVVHGDRLVGILTQTDLLDAFLSGGQEP